MQLYFVVLLYRCAGDVSWMDITMTTIVKMTKHKLRLLEHTESISKWPTGSVYIGNIVYHLTCLSAFFLKGLEVDLEGSSIFPTFILLMHIDRLGLYCQL